MLNEFFFDLVGVLLISYTAAIELFYSGSALIVAFLTESGSFEEWVKPALFSSFFKVASYLVCLINFWFLA